MSHGLIVTLMLFTFALGVLFGLTIQSDPIIKMMAALAAGVTVMLIAAVLTGALK